MKMLFMYVQDLYRLFRITFLLNLLLMVVLGMLEGVGILMIIPLLMTTGIVSGRQPGSEWAFGLDQFFQNLGLTLQLPLVLVVYTGINFGQTWLQRRQALLNVDMQQKFAAALSIRLFQAVAYAKWQLLMTKTKADITNIIMTELLRVYSGINTCLQMTSAVVVTCIQISIAFMLAPGLTCSVLAGAAVLFALLRTCFKKSRRLGETIAELNSRLFADLTEYIDGIKDVKSHGIEAVQIQRFSKTRHKMQENLSGFVRLQTRADMYNKAGAVIFISLFLFSAVTLFQLNPQHLILVAVISARLWPKLAALQMGVLTIQSLLPAFQAVQELEQQCLAAREDIAEDASGQRLELTYGVEYRNVSFYYEAACTKYALADMNVMLPAGTTTALVGASGSGKSTMVDLLIGLLTPVKGAILVDGKLLVKNLRSWRNSIGYVPQEPFLLHTSIRGNLQWACPEASEDSIWEALQLAAIDTFVRKLPDGLDTVVGDRGVRLSGGERQRIVLARALLRKPSVLVLDEATSSLDAENEKRIQQAIDNLQGKMTIVIIAHRISTIQHADTILVVEQGRIVEQGNYQSLMANRNGCFHALSCAAGA